MSLPVNIYKEDIDALVKILRRKSVGVTMSDAKGTIENKLLDARKMAAYRAWGFIVDSGDKIRLSPRGQAYADASEDEKTAIFREIVRAERICILTLEYLAHRKGEQITVPELGSHWVTHFKTEVSGGAESYINSQVTTFMQLAEAAGLGSYIKGAKGKQTRLEFNKSAIEAFLNADESSAKNDVDEGADETSDSEPLGTENESPLQRAMASTQPVPRRAPEAAPAPAAPVPPQMPAGPALHIDIQIHIAADSTPEVINAVFASMAKHLYKSDPAAEE